MDFEVGQRQRAEGKELGDTLCADIDSGSVLAVAAVGTIGLVMLSGQQAPGGPFTAAQAAAGRTAYQAQLRELSSRRSQGQRRRRAAGGLRVHGRLGPAHDARAAVVHAADDAADAARRVEPGGVPQHRGVHPAVERRAARQHRAHAAGRCRDQRGGERPGPGRRGGAAAGTRRAAAGRASRRAGAGAPAGRPRASRSTAR